MSDYTLTGHIVMGYFEGRESGIFDLIRTWHPNPHSDISRTDQLKYNYLHHSWFAEILHVKAAIELSYK